MADRFESDRPCASRGLEGSAELLKRTIEETQAEESRGLPPGRAQSFITLVRGIDGLTTSLASEIAAEFGGHVTPS
jgi:hypothetical protein